MGALRPIGISYFVFEQFISHLEPMDICKAKPAIRLCNFAVRRRMVFSHLIVNMDTFSSVSVLEELTSYYLLLNKIWKCVSD